MVRQRGAGDSLYQHYRNRKVVGKVTQTIDSGFLDPVQFGCPIAYTDEGKDREDDVKNRVQ